MSEAMITRRGGGGSSRLQSKAVSITEAPTTVIPDSGYDGMASVTVNIAAESQKAAETFTPGTQAQTIAANKWLAGAQTIQGDANLLATNIKKGVSIFGVAGLYEAVLDTNSAILKVVTSTGCSVTVTNGTDTFTQQDADGFVRPNDANVTEHFFVIPTAAFGTFSVTSTHPTYGDNTKTNAVVIGNAGKVYEVLCGGINIILDSTFGLQDGIQLYREEVRYDDINKQIIIPSNVGSDWLFGNSVSGGAVIPIAAYTGIKITAASGPTASAGYLYLRDQADRTLATIGTNFSPTTSTAAITNKYYDTAGIYFHTVSQIIEIILT